MSAINQFLRNLIIFFLTEAGKHALSLVVSVMKSYCTFSNHLLRLRIDLDLRVDTGNSFLSLWDSWLIGISNSVISFVFALTSLLAWRVGLGLIIMRTGKSFQIVLFSP